MRTITLNPPQPDEQALGTPKLTDREKLAAEFGISLRQLQKYLNLAKWSEDFLRWCNCRGEKVIVPKKLHPFQVDLLRCLLRDRDWGMERLEAYLLSESCEWTFENWSKQTQ